MESLDRYEDHMINMLEISRKENLSYEDDISLLIEATWEIPRKGNLSHVKIITDFYHRNTEERIDESWSPIRMILEYKRALQYQKYLSTNME